MLKTKTVDFEIYEVGIRFHWIRPHFVREKVSENLKGVARIIFSAQWFGNTTPIPNAKK